MIIADPEDSRGKAAEYRAMLAGRLGVADDEAFLQLLWALDALQTGRSAFARPYLTDVPEGADVEGICGPKAIRPWELETLANELLASPKDPHYRLFDTRSFPAIAATVSLLRHLENEEYCVHRHERSVFHEMGRIGARQFEWQRGYFNLADFYRSAFVYGQGACADQFERVHGVSIADVTFVGFTLMTAFRENPVIRPSSDLRLLHDLGVEPAKLRPALARIARPHSQLRQEAAILRQGDGEIAYKPSVLRQFPCVLIGPKGRRMRAPVPDLVASRVTNGLFYDVVGGGRPIREDYGRRFEAYALALLAATLPDTRFEPEARYRTKLGGFTTPDIVMLDRDGAVRLAIECKADWMGYGARFGDDPASERGYDEMAKGVFQAWRFIAHSRRGLTGRTIAPDARCVVLALHDWFSVRAHLLDKVMERAIIRAAQSTMPIEAEDRLPVAFCSIFDLEQMLRTATERSLLATIELASVGGRRGWHWSSLHDDVTESKTGPRPYPFEDEVGRLLPWWSRLDDPV